MQERGKHRGRKTKETDLKPKENQESSYGASGSRKKKTKCPNCMRGFHPESQCMKNTIDQLSTLLEQKNNSIPQGLKKFDAGKPT